MSQSPSALSPLWTTSEVVEATGGKTAGDWQATHVSIDSRAIGTGGLFVAIIGERVDGHQYVKQAMDAGAVAAIVSKPVAGVAADKLVVVGDTFQALEALGVYSRKRTQAHIIGVTGSVGKTTTKEALRLMCEAFGDTFASQGNFNNHFGAPLSLANMSAGTEFGVFEMGMNHAGEISGLTKMVRPHVAIITTVEAVHLEFFKDEQGIAAAKAEIFEGLELGGTAILNADNEHTEFIENIVGDIATITVGVKKPADVRKVASALTNQGSRLTVEANGKSVDLALTTSNVAVDAAILASIATAKALGLDLDKAASQLENFAEVEGRGQVESVELDGKTMWWIDDSYNASPASMRAAFETLATVKQQRSAERTIAVLGDMLELGEQSQSLHEGLASALAEHDIGCVYTVGGLMKHLYDELKSSHDHAAHYATLSEMEEALKDQLQANDIVLFKGSNGSKIHQLVKNLRE